MHPSSRTVASLLLLFLLLGGCAKTEHLLEAEESLELLTEFQVETDVDHEMFQPAALAPEGVVLIGYDSYPSYNAATLHDLETRLIKRTFSLPFGFGRIYEQRAVAVSPDGKYLAVAGTYEGRGSGFAIWNVADGTVEFGPVSGSGVGDIACLKFSDDGTRIALGGRFGVVVWKMGSTAREVKFTADYFPDVTGVDFSPTGDTVLSSPAGFWSVPDGSLVEDFEDVRGYFSVAAFLDDGGKVIAGGNDGLSLFAREKTDEIGHIHNYYYDDSFGDPAIKSIGIASIATSQDRGLIATGDYGGQVKVLDAHSGTLITWSKVAETQKINGLAFAPFDNTLLVASSGFGSVFVLRIHQ